MKYIFCYSIKKTSLGSNKLWILDIVLIISLTYLQSIIIISMFSPGQQKNFLLALGNYSDTFHFHLNIHWVHLRQLEFSNQLTDKSSFRSSFPELKKVILSQYTQWQLLNFEKFTSNSTKNTSTRLGCFYVTAILS